MELDCWVELNWPASHGIWWSTHHEGTSVQIGAALDELAVRVRSDALTRVMLHVDPYTAIHYDILISSPKRDLLHCNRTVALVSLSVRLHGYASEVRGLQLR